MERLQNELSDIAQVDQEPSLRRKAAINGSLSIKERINIMGYKLKTHSGAAKSFKKTGSSVKSRGANRNHILTKQSTKEKDIIEDLNKLNGTVLKMAT